MRNSSRLECQTRLFIKQNSVLHLRFSNMDSKHVQVHMAAYNALSHDQLISDMGLPTRRRVRAAE